MQGNIVAHQSMGRDLEFLMRVVLLGVMDGSPLQVRDFKRESTQQPGCLS
jgi:hypothetical protein